jgi:hypothetical protein
MYGDYLQYQTMNNRLYIFISALVGVITGFVTIHSFLAHSWSSLILWIGVGLVILYFSPNRRTAIYAGAVFGFLDIAAWLLSGFQGTASQLTGIFSIMTIASPLCAAAGALGAVIFYWLFRRSKS